VNVRVALSHPALPAGTYVEELQYAILDIEPVANSGAERPPLNLVVVVDGSATMHHFQFTDDEREYWMTLALQRNEIERGKADERDAVYWTGQTLQEIQTTARKPMSLVVDGLKQLLSTLTSQDKVSVIAFADRPHVVFTEQDWGAFPDRCYRELDNLKEGRLPVDIGTGTYMSDALNHASDLLLRNASGSGVSRLIVITDGIVQDPAASLGKITALQERGIAITTIGVGEEFDEEFLIRVADNSRGEYHYAADSQEITRCLNQELSALQATSVTDMYIAIRGLGGSCVQDLFMVRPSMAIFDEIYTEDEWIRARIGDVSNTTPAGVLVQFAPPSAPEGPRPVLEAQLAWSYTAPGSGASKGNEKKIVTAEFSRDPYKTAQTDPAVGDLVDRFTVFKYEREAQRAQERGNFELAKEKLGAATKRLHDLGEHDLAADMEEQMQSVGKKAADTKVLKRIKSTTRRLASGGGATKPLN
jgi:Ca-activated chloride channel family protein